MLKKGKFNFAYINMFLIEGSLKVKLPTVWTDAKAEAGRVREEKRREEKEAQERRCRHAKR